MKKQKVWKLQQLKQSTRVFFSRNIKKNKYTKNNEIINKGIQYQTENKFKNIAVQARTEFNIQTVPKQSNAFRVYKTRL